MTRLFGTDGVRGKANEELTCELAYGLGKAACMVLAKAGEPGDRPVFIIGRDTRISGEMLENALAAGIMSAGGNVIKAGVIPTPGIAVLIRKLKADSGVVISASHNPYYDNGIKFFNSEGLKLPDETEDEIQKVMEEQSWNNASPERIGTVSDLIGADELYTKEILEKLPKVDLTGKKIVLDCANGAQSFIAPGVFSSLGAEVIAINTCPNGTNINDSCGSTHLEALSQKVRETKADLGMAFDGDADRLLAVDENGNTVDGDKIMFLLARYMKEEGTLFEDTLVLTVMSNLGLKKALAAEGIRIVETTVGDRYILKEMLEKGYTLGGEQSGHIINKTVNSTGDGLATALLLAHVLTKSGKTLTETFGGFDLYPQILLNVKTTPENKLRYIGNEEVAAEVKAIEDRYDSTGRILLRHSGTEPLVRIMIEGEDPDVIQKDAEYLAEVIDRICNGR